VNQHIHNISKTNQGRELTHTHYFQTIKGSEPTYTQYLQDYSRKRTNTC